MTKTVFPSLKSEKGGGGGATDAAVSSVWFEGGMSDRQLFAALAMIGFTTLNKPATATEVATKAVQYADALIKELEK